MDPASTTANSVNIEEDSCALQAAITRQQSHIKLLKKNGATNKDVVDEVAVLADLRAKLAALEVGVAAASNRPKFNRKAFDELILRKMYLVPSFEIHNGPAGFFDYGPMACVLKANVLAIWRQHFTLEDNVLEIECTNLTPSNVLETSGHVERFTDLMVRDEVTNECFRADKLLEDGIDAFLELPENKHMPASEVEGHRLVQRLAESYTPDELHEKLNLYKIKSPSNGTNDLTHPFPFNLMFKTTIGPEGSNVGYLRPETAQGMFINFRRLLEYNQGKMPMAAAQIGLGFRNEIAPRNGLLRVREFCLAEIEHFCDPLDKSHAKFHTIADTIMVLFDREGQLGSGRTVTTTIGAAVESGMVNNQTLGYYMARTQAFLERVGVDPSRMRFRQHLLTEMAHYAKDCWDMEIKTCYGWIECVGHADRAAYDLERHSEKTGVPLVASRRLPEPIVVDRIIAEPNKKAIGPIFKGDQKKVLALLEEMDDAAVDAFKKELEANGDAGVMLAGLYKVTPDLVSFKAEKKSVFEVKYTPSVVEPAYGIGRIMYAILEHAFSQRNGDEQRCVMSFPSIVAPIKVGIFQLIKNPAFEPFINRTQSSFVNAGISVKVDSGSGTIGRRYARADEIGIPFGVTIDFQTLLDGTVTVRDRNTMAQIRVPSNSLTKLIGNLISGEIMWSTAMKYFTVVNAGGDDSDYEEGERGDKKPAIVSPIIVETFTRGSFSRPNPACGAK